MSSRWDGCGEMTTRTNKLEDRFLFRLTLRQPLLAATLSLALLGFLPDARLLVKPAPLQFPEEPFAREFFLGDFERFINVVIEDFDFHSFRFRTFPGDACASLIFAPG